MATQWHCPQEWSEWVEWLSAGLHGRCRWRLPVLMGGMLFAKGRRTVTSWLRAAGIRCDFPGYYYFLAVVGKSAWAVATQLLLLLLKHLPEGRVLLALDDTPTRRYGPKVQGAGIHRNPTPGPTEQQFVYGHIWVTLSWIVRHPRWGTIGLPLLALLYVRQKDLGKIPKKYGWSFATKIVLAQQLVSWAARLLVQAGRQFWVVADGFYAKSPFVRAVVAAGGTLVGRLNYKARLWELPPQLRPGQKRGRGKPRKYGKKRFSLAKRAGHKRGWQQVECTVYGRTELKTVKTFLAVSKLVSGVLRVVIIKEDYGWFPFYCTDPNATVREIVEAAADRTTIEQNFHDLKEVWGLGQQQVRNIWANVGAFLLNLWAHTLVELWAWGRPQGHLSDRRASPWDDPQRRPSHADRRKSLQRQCVREEYSALWHGQPLSRKTQNLFHRLAALVV